MSINYNKLSKLEILWEAAEQPGEFITLIDGETWYLNLNPEFPFEDAYTLTNASESLDFNVWPDNWLLPNVKVRT